MTSTTAPQTFTNTDYAAATAEADRINEAYAADRAVTVHGRVVWCQFGKPAHVYSNGSLSVEVRSIRQPNKSQTLWVKAGQSAPVEIA